MADVPFNPTTPTVNSPNWWEYSKPIQQPMANESWKYALAGAGQAIDQAVSGLDTSVKKGIDNQLNDQIDAKRQAFTRQLQQIDQGLHQPTIADTSGGSLTGGGADKNAPIPDQIQSGLQSLQTMKSVRANGRFDDTYYQASQDMILKDLRAQYPGYKDYIDSKASEILARNLPANRVVAGLIQNINTFVGNQQAERNKVGSELLSNLDALKASVVVKGVPTSLNGVAVWQAWQNHQIDDATALQGIAEKKALLSRLEVEERQNRVFEGDRNVVSQKAQRVASDAINGLVAHSLSDMVTITGMKPETLQQWITDIQSGKVKPNQEQAQQLAEAYASHQAAAAQQIDALLNTRRANSNGTTTTWGIDIGTEKLDALKQGWLKPFADITQYITNREYGPAYSATNYLKAYSADAGRWMTEADKNQYFRMLAGQKALGIDTMSKDLNEIAIRNKWPAVISGTLDFLQKKAATQDDVKQGGPKFTQSDAIDKFGNTAIPPEVTKHILGWNKYVKDPNVPDDQKFGIAQSIFDPKNADILSPYNTDKHDIQGNFIPGKYTRYWTYTDLPMVQNLKQLASKYDTDGTFSKNILSWSTTQFYTLFRQDIEDLNNYAEQGKGLKFTYHPDTVSFSVEFPKDEALKYYHMHAQQGIDRHVQDQVDNLNRGLAGLGNVAHEFGGQNPGITIYSFLRQMGFNTNNVQGIPQSIMKAIEDQQKADEEAKKPVSEAADWKLQSTPMPSVSPIITSR